MSRTQRFLADGECTLVKWLSVVVLALICEIKKREGEITLRSGEVVNHVALFPQRGAH